MSERAVWVGFNTASDEPHRSSVALQRAASPPPQEPCQTGHNGAENRGVPRRETEGKMAKKTAKKAIRRGRRGAQDSSGSVPSQPARDGGGEPAMEFVKALLEFADNLRDNATEAETYYEDKVRSRLGGQAKKNTETRFFNRAQRLAVELQGRRTDFEQLQARCPSQAPGRRIIDDLAAAGLSDHLLRLGDDLRAIASRSANPIGAEDREQLDIDRRAILHTIVDLIPIAEWIESQARTSRGNPMPWREGDTRAPTAIDGLLQEAEERARRFLQTMATRPADFGRRNNETTLQWLRYLREEKERLGAETAGFAAVLGKFTDEHLEAAERMGHKELQTLLTNWEAVVERVAARREVSIQLTKAVIDNLIRRLSISEGGADAAATINYALDGVKSQLDEQRQLLRAYEASAARNCRVAETHECDLPDWEEIYGDGEREGTKKAGLWMLVMAFQDPDADGQEFSTATKRMLANRLAARFGGQIEDYFGSWLDRRVKVACENKIVVPVPRVRGSSKTLGDRFELCAAAIRKYRGNFPGR